MRKLNLDENISLEKTGYDKTINKNFGDIEICVNELIDRQQIKIYGVKIDKNNSNPQTAVEYTDDAIGKTPATMGTASEWDDVFPYNNIRRVMFKNGTPNYYFKKSSKTLKEDGTDADITSGNDGDVMIELPLVYYKYWEDTQYEYRKISNVQIDDTWIPIAHRRGNEIKNKAYTAAYKGWKDDTGKLRSLSGKLPDTSQTLANTRTSAQANGTGYDSQIYQITQLIQILYLIKYKNRDSQTAVGKGLTSVAAKVNTGGTDLKPDDFGDQTGTTQMCLFGIEDFTGNIWEWNEGIIKKLDNKIYLANTGFNDSGNDYTAVCDSPTQGYITKTVQGFIPSATGGASNTYYCDHYWVNLTILTAALFGGHWADGAYVGCFFLVLNIPPANMGSTIGARLCFL